MQAPCLNVKWVFPGLQMTLRKLLGAVKSPLPELLGHADSGFIVYPQAQRTATWLLVDANYGGDYHVLPAPCAVSSAGRAPDS